MRYVIREPLAIVASLLVVLTAGIVAFSLLGKLTETSAVVGLTLFSLLPLLAVIGAVVFFLAIRSEGFRGE